MTTLQDINGLLRSTINSIENAIELEGKLEESYVDFMDNAKAIEIGGLKMPNLFHYIQELNLQKQILLTLKFHVECQMKDNNIKDITNADTEIERIIKEEIADGIKRAKARILVLDPVYPETFIYKRMNSIIKQALGVK